MIDDEAIDDQAADDQAAVAERPKECTADLDRAYPICIRCGLAWRRGELSPACQRITVGRLRGAVVKAISTAEGAHLNLVQLAAAGAGGMVDEVAPLIDAAELRAALKFFDLVFDGDDGVLQMVADANRKKKRDMNG